MRMFFVLPAALLLALSLLACQEQSGQPAQPKIAVVDMARLMRDSVPGKDGVKFIESMQTDMQKKLDEIQDRLEKNPQDEEAMRELQRVYSSSQQRMQAEGQNVVNILLDAVQRVLNSYRESQGYDIIVGTDALAAFNPKIDVTEAVMAEVDKQKITFKPLPENALPSQALGEDAPAKAEEPSAEEKADKAKAEDKAPADKNKAKPAK